MLKNAVRRPKIFVSLWDCLILGIMLSLSITLYPVDPAGRRTKYKLLQKLTSRCDHNTATNVIHTVVRDDTDRLAHFEVDGVGNNVIIANKTWRDSDRGIDHAFHRYHFEMTVASDARNLTGYTVRFCTHGECPLIQHVSGTFSCVACYRILVLVMHCVINARMHACVLFTSLVKINSSFCLGLWGGGAGRGGSSCVCCSYCWIQVCRNGYF